MKVVLPITLTSTNKATVLSVNAETNQVTFQLTAGIQMTTTISEQTEEEKGLIVKDAKVLISTDGGVKLQPKEPDINTSAGSNSRSTPKDGYKVRQQSL